MMQKIHQELFRRRFSIVATGAVFLAFWSSFSSADDPSKTIDVTPPRITATAKLSSSDKPTYPRPAFQENREGWVLVKFDIDETGQVQDAIALDSVGDSIFEVAALNSVSRWHYEPALLNSQPVRQGRNITYVAFAIDLQPHGYSKVFADRYNDVFDLIKNDQIDGANRLAKSAFDGWPMNLHELAKLWSLRAQLALTRNDSLAALAALQRATANNGQWLDQQNYQSLLLAKIHIEIESGRFKSAIDSWQELLKLNPKQSEELTQTTHLIEALQEIITGDETLAAGGYIHQPDGCDLCEARWSFQPARSRFTIGNVNGELRSVDISCDGAQVSLAFKAGAEWHVPQQSGECRVDILGTEKTTFDVHQLSN